MQRWEITGRGDGVVRGRRRGVNRAMVRKHVTWHPCPVLVLSQVGFCFRGSLLDCSSVVVLMAGQGGTAGEGLLAVRIRTLVGALSGVDSAMSCERRGITKRLYEKSC